MDGPGNNNLLNAYRSHRSTSTPFGNNRMLSTNPAFTSGINYNRSQQMLQMKRLQEAQMQKLRRIQEIKKAEKQNAMKQLNDKSKLSEIIIKPVQLEKNNEDVMPEFADKEKNMEAERDNKKGTFLDKAWKKRTNKAYKNVLKNVLKEDDYTVGKYKKKDDLIVHRITDADKDYEELEEELKEMEDSIEKHNDELKSIYSLSEKAKHKKVFEYNKVFKSRIKEEPSSHRKMKDDKLSELKNEQKRREKGRKKYDTIVENLINKNIIPEEELKEIMDEQKEENDMMKQLGAEVDDLPLPDDSDDDKPKSKPKRRRKEKGVHKAREEKHRKRMSHKQSEVEVVDVEAVEKKPRRKRPSRKKSQNIDKVNIDKMDDDDIIEIDIDELLSD